jgi:hypothetical protein
MKSNRFSAFNENDYPREGLLSPLPFQKRKRSEVRRLKGLNPTLLTLTLPSIQVREGRMQLAPGLSYLLYERQS